MSVQAPVPALPLGVAYALPVGRPLSDYRPELDGLRALAVLAVVLYHLRLPALPGGFLGVDVFFVLSGYLIVGLLTREHEASGRIRWMAFYARRFRRLLPVFAVVLVATLLGSAWAHFPFGDQQWVGRAGVFATFSLSNVMLWSSKAAYFDAATEQLPLLHTWSLSVEEQFYLLVPVLFWGAARASRRLAWPWRAAFRRLVWGLILLSLSLAVWQSSASPLAAYYLPQARIFEFLLGGLAALGLRSGAAPWRAPLATLAVLGLVLAMLWASRGGGSVGWTIFTAITTTVLLWALAGPEPMAVRRLLASAPMVWVGQRSYGWYLWHFPVLVLWRAYWLEDTSIGGDLALSLAALLLAHFTYVGVEQPGRHAAVLTALGPARLLGLAFAMLLALAGLSGGLALWAKHVARPGQAMQVLEARIFDRGAMTAPCLDFGAGQLDALPAACQHGAADAPAQVYLWGDSHAAQYQPALVGLPLALPVKVAQLTHAGCPPLLDYGVFTLDPARLARCQMFREQSLARILDSAARQPTVVVLATYWVSYLLQPTVNANLRNTRALNQELPAQAVAQRQLEVALERTLSSLSAGGVRIIVVGPPPEPRVSGPYCLHRFGEQACRNHRADIEAHRATTLASLRRITSAVPGAQLIDPIDVLCDATWCPASLGGRVLFFDSNHLSAAGAGLLQPQLSAAVMRSLR
jgi:peptidoglycan/LPS O-acetylase OafA/YrhL